MTMSVADTHGAVFERGSAVLLARVVDAFGDTIRVSDVVSIQYTVNELDAKHNAKASVPGHNQITLPVSEVFHDTLQTPSIWTVDDVGYNFRHDIDVSQHDAFPQAGRAYQVRYELQPSGGQKIVFRFLLKAI